ncbi:MAG: hypothetical protein LBD78_09110, partial [Spirochaetaceae bacterium]|nr:hypothetical protein [Spirochaetaceae bacterium]
MKKFFLKPLYLGIILSIAYLTGCQNPLEPPRDVSVSRNTGRVLVTIGNAAAEGAARTIAPDESEFTKYTLTFSGPEEEAPKPPVDLTGVNTYLAELSVGSWTITVTGYTETDDGDVEAAEGSATITVVSGETSDLDIVLGPKTGGAQGTFGYSLEIPDGLSSSELIITTAEGDAVETIPLSYSYAGITGTRGLDPGQYLVRIRLQKGSGEAALYAGRTEALHIYSGLTSTLPLLEFTENDFKTAVSVLDLTGMVTAPVVWANPVTAFGGNDQYTGTVAWKESDGAPIATGVFGGNKVYKAVVTLTVKTDYVFTGVAENSFTYSGATVVNAADSGVVTITFPVTETQSITGVTVSPASSSVAQGGIQTFTATVTGTTGSVPQGVTWTVGGNSDEGTGIAEDGTLTIALNESVPSSLTVTATSIADLSQNGTATVTVTTTLVKTIASYTDLAKIGADPDYPLGGKYKLTADITLTNWTPIGDAAAPFYGVLDGDGRTITLQSFDAGAVSEKTYLGIFGYVKGGSVASKAGLKNLTITSSVDAVSTKATGQAIGLLAGYAENTEIADIAIQGSFTFSTEKIVYAGGIVGIALSGTVVRDCTGKVTLNAKGGTGGQLVSGLAVFNYVGGFVGIFKDGVDI